MEQSVKDDIVYTSRRKRFNSVQISTCNVVCEKRHRSLNSLSKEMEALKTKDENGRNGIVKTRRKKRKRKFRECDEVTRLQRRARYLLVKIKLKLNLLEAYRADGWKGRSREKIKPEKELERAQKEIIKCKLGIREIIRELDLLVSTCQCGSHQRCLESPEKVPGADNKNLCKYDENKIMIIETINAHLCTSFSPDSSYVDIFKEEITNTDSKDLKFKDEIEWPSDESDDEDYDPALYEVTSNGNETEEADSDKLDLSNSTTGNFNSDNSCGEADEVEISQQPRKRTNVDYKKLHDEMFGKDAESKEESGDEEWGPHVRKRSMKEENVDRFMFDNSTRDANKVLHDDVPENMSKYSRIPTSAVKELQQEFAKNELPSRSVKDNLSEQLGLSTKKVDGWFKNARYAALKLLKASASNCEEKKRESDEILLLDASCFLPLSKLVHVPKRSGSRLKRNKASKTQVVQFHIDKNPSLASRPGKKLDSIKGIGIEHENL